MLGAWLAVVLSLSPPVEISTTTGAVTLDGRLDEAAWQRASAHPLEHQKEPVGGGAASLPSSWKAVVIGDALYVGIRAEHVPTEGPPVAQVARRTRRDRDVESDRVFVDIDTRGRGQDAFHFEVTSGGSFVDGVRYNDTKLDKQWDGFWDAAVQRDERGYTVEMEIPLRLLRRSPGETAPVHIQVRRYISKLGELDEWAPTPRDKSREVSAYLPVGGLVLPKRRLTLDLLPYMSTGATVETAGGGGPASAAYILRGGGDAKLQIGSDVSIDVTAYPDFGTVEADTAVFNLNPVEVRFPEKRPFFLEGTDVLNAPLELFYSRRIGSLTGTTAGTAVETAPPAPVLGAAKLLARAGKRWSFAGLAAVTASQDLDVRDTELGTVAPQRVAPTYLYGVLRARRDIPFGGYFGALASSRTGFDRGPLRPWTACPDGQTPAAHGRTQSCFADVYALGPDLLVRSKNGKWRGEAQLAGTYRHGGTVERYNDGHQVQSGDLGGGARVMAEKTGGRVIGWLRYEWYGRNADWNATGFLPRPNHHFARGHLALQNLTPRGPVFEDRWQVELFQRFGLDGLPMGSGYQVNHRARWKSFWRHFLELHYRPGYFDNREARDGTPVQRIGLVGLELSVNSDPRRLVVGGFESTYQQRWNGLRGNASLNFDLNLFGPVQLRLGAEGTIDRGEPRWMETDPDFEVYRLARLYAHALGFITRLNYTITPKLELQLYAQLLGVGRVFDDGFTAPFDAGRIRLDALDPDPDFERTGSSEALLVANLFLRWEYVPGSNIYLVATRNQLDTLDPTRQGQLDYANVGRAAAAYTFLVKATYLLGW